MKTLSLILAAACLLAFLFLAGCGLAMSIDFCFPFVEVLKQPVVYGSATLATIFGLCGAKVNQPHS